jgi:hypothetical protein
MGLFDYFAETSAFSKRMGISFIVGSFLLSCSLSGAEAVRLQYIADSPVLETDELKVSVDQLLPGVKLDLQALQSMQSTLKIISEQSGSPVSQPPLDMEFILKGMKISLRGNGLSVSYDAADPGNSIDMLQISRLLDRPIHLHLNKDHVLEGNTKELELLLKELPILQQLQGISFLQEFFQHLFALAGMDLEPGKQFQKKIDTEGSATQPTIWNYEVTSITDEEVFAKVSATINPKSLKLGVSAEGENKTGFGVELVFLGTVSGNLAWKRQNALLYRMNVEHLYKGSLKFGGQEWSITATVTQNSTSTPFKP